MKNVLVLGAGGFIGNHMVSRLKSSGYWVKGVDLVYPEFEQTSADEFIVGDLRDRIFCNTVIDRTFDEIYQFAADMGGAGYLFSGEHDADVVHNSAMINLNVAARCSEIGVGRLFFSSSACVYPEYNQIEPDSPHCSEDSVYPAAPDSEYGWEKLFSERLFLSFRKNYKLDVRIARLHNIFGPRGCWKGGREKVPAALCRKIALAMDGGEIEVWGDGLQTRSFLYIDECIEAIDRLMKSQFSGPVNIGSEEMISINTLASIIMTIAGKNMTIRNIPGPLGVRGRNSDNKLIQKALGWSPSSPLKTGLAKTYAWISDQVTNNPNY